MHDDINSCYEHIIEKHLSYLSSKIFLLKLIALSLLKIANSI